MQSHLLQLSKQVGEVQSQQTNIMNSLWYLEHLFQPIPLRGLNDLSPANSVLPGNFVSPSPSVPMQSTPTPRQPLAAIQSTPSAMTMSTETSGIRTEIPVANTNDVNTNMAVVSPDNENMPVVRPTNENVCNLPAIDISKLLLPDEVTAKYPKLLVKGKLSRLAVRLAQESFFGKDVMRCCTVKGNGDYHALPAGELVKLKNFMISLCVPRYFTSNASFEITWKTCIESIGQSCKGLRQ